MSHQNIWLDWFSLNRLVAAKSKIYLYGRSEDWVHKCLNKLAVRPQAIIDRDPAYHGSYYHGLPIFPLNEVEDLSDSFFIITAGEYDGIIDGLLALGLTPGLDFACSPDFKDYRTVIEFHELNFEILISCSDYNDQMRARSSRLGGGFYIYNTKTAEIEKVATGSFRQFEKYSGQFVAVDYVSREVVFFDEKFNVKKTVALPKSNYCGLAIDHLNDVAFLANAGDDSIMALRDLSGDNPWFEELSVLPDRQGRNRESHINDLFFCDNKLFFSYFSRSGNYKYNVFDGGVSHFDFESGTLESESISNLWKPHSPRVIDGKLWVLDSMRGALVSGCGHERVEVGGFARGLDYLENVFVIGQSQDMYLSDRMSQGCAVSVDSGINLFDVTSGALRFLPINKIMNIHDLKILRYV